MSSFHLVAFTCCLVCVSGYFSRFDRMVSLDIKDINDVSSVTQTSLTLDQCAKECHDNSSCNIFTYNAVGGRCRVMSKAVITDDEDDDGNKAFGKNAVCPGPSVNNGQIVSFTGLDQGSRADFVCDDFYVPTIASAICDVSGTWPGLNTACQPFTVMPVSIPAEDKIVSSSCFVLIATPPVGITSISIEYIEPPSDVHLLINPRFNHGSDSEKIVRNSELNGAYGTEERDIPYWPFQEDREFNFTICCEDTQYKGIVDGVDIFTFAFRRDPSEVKNITLYNMSLRSVRFIG